jgi:hypothetical protein
VRLHSAAPKSSKSTSNPPFKYQQLLNACIDDASCSLHAYQAVPCCSLTAIPRDSILSGCSSQPRLLVGLGLSRCDTLCPNVLCALNATTGPGFQVSYT